jgi:hypothetical protein
MSDPPMPPGVDDETAGTIREGFANEAQPLKDQATQAFKSAVDKSRELDFVNDCTRDSLKMLRNTYAPEMYPEVHEDRVALKKGAALALGGDVLVTIQDVPPPVAQDEATAQAKSEEIQEDLTDLTQKLREQTATDVSARPAATAQDGTKPQKASTDDEEPEDFL